MKTRRLVVILILAGLITYGNTVRNELFWDDDDNIVNNVYIHNFDLGKILTRSQIEGSLGQVSNQYRPILILSYAIEYKLWGLSPGGYHGMNVLLHITNSILVFFLIQSLLQIYGIKYLVSSQKEASHPDAKYKILNTLYISFFTALLFLLHPMQTEAVTYVAGRTYLLPTFFILLGLLVFLHSSSKRQAASSKE